MLAMEMKANGSYLSRGLSYRDAEFELATAPLTAEQRAGFDAACHFWTDRLLPELEAAIQRTKTPAGQLTRAYWSAHQRFFKQLCVCAKVPALVERVRRALADGMSPIIGLQSTGEAALERAAAEDGDLRAPISLCAAMLVNFIEHNFPVSTTADPKLAKDLAKAETQLAESIGQLAQARVTATRADVLTNAAAVLEARAVQRHVPAHAEVDEDDEVVARLGTVRLGTLHRVAA